MNIDPKVCDVISSLDPSLDITEATGNEDAECSFGEEANFTSFIKKNVRGISIHVSQEKRDELVHTLQMKLGREYTVYFSEQHFGHEPDKITILATTDQYDALYFEGTNGINYDITVEDVVRHLQQLEKEHPFVLTGVGFDFVQGTFTSPLTNVEEVAERMYEFCPDIVEQGTETVEALAEELTQSNSFYYWWD